MKKKTALAVSDRRQTFRKIKRYRYIYLMLLPVVAYFLVFSYYPLALGVYNSLHDVKLLGDSTFVGFDNYISVIENPLYRQALGNTLFVGIGTFLLQFIWGLAIALILNEIRKKVFRSTMQTITYIPYLLSWSVVGGLWITLLSPTGMVNGIFEQLASDAFKPIVFMSEPAYARMIMIFTGAWKGAGYFAALFLAAVVTIDPSIYEAASMDGASRFRQITKITLPSIVPTMKIVTVLSAMSVMRNFDQIFVMSNASIHDEVRNLLYLIYQDGIVKMKVGPATAAATYVLIATMIISFTVRRLTKYDETYT